MALAFLERRLRRLALDDFLLQLQVRGGQLHGALAQHLHDLIQMDGRLPRAAMRCLNRRDGLGKENPRLPDDRHAFAGRAARQHFREQRLLVELGQVQRLQSGGQGLAPQSSRRLQARRAALLQVSLQRHLIASGKFAFHASSNLRAACRTDWADFATNCCARAISFFSPGCESGPAPASPGRGWRPGVPVATLATSGRAAPAPGACATPSHIVVTTRLVLLSCCQARFSGTHRDA